MPDPADTGTDNGPQPTGFLDTIGGIFDGVADVVDTVSDISDSGADIAEDVARGRGAIHDEQFDHESGDLNLRLRKNGHERGDNVQLYYVIGIAAVALIFLMRK